MNEHGPVVVIGGANLDVIGQTDTPLNTGSSTPGRIRSGLGGVARNIAENLARLEVETLLLTAVGDDDAGHRIFDQATGSGIDVSEALTMPNCGTGAYLALLDSDGAVNVAVDDMSIMNHLTPDYFQGRRHLFRDARLLVLDANLSPDSLNTVIDLCHEYDVPICGDPTSTSLAPRLKPHLADLLLISPNVIETGVLCGDTFAPHDRDAALAAARHLVQLGVESAIITLGEYGVVYGDSDTAGHIPAVQTEVVDQTGHGDAMTAAVIFGLLEDIPLDECVRLGVRAATLTLRTRETVRADLSVDLLYDDLDEGVTVEE